MSKRDDDSQTDMEVGMTTAERRRRRRRGGGLRVPSDNVPRRPSTPPVVAPVPEDPALAMSIAYSFTSESSEPVARASAPSFENHEVMATVIDPVSGPVEQADFEMKTREMTAVDLEALGLDEPGASNLGMAALRLSSPRIEPPAPSGGPGDTFTDLQFKKREATDPAEAEAEVEVDIDHNVDGGTTLDQPDDEEEEDDAIPERPGGGRPVLSAASELFDPPPLYKPGRAQTVALSEEDLEEVREAARLATQPPTRPGSTSIPPPMPSAKPLEFKAQREESGSVPEIDIMALEDRAAEASGEYEVDVDGIVDARPTASPAAPAIPPAAPPEARVRTSQSMPQVHAHPTAGPPPRDSQPTPIVREAYGPRDSQPTPIVRDAHGGRESQPTPVVREAPAPPPPPVAHKAPPAPPPAKKDKPSAPTAAATLPKPDAKPARGKPWFVDLFDEDYLRTLPFLTPQATQAEAEFVIDAMGLQAGAQVLDVGCGYGRHAMELAARGFHVVGLDMSTPLLVRGGEEAHRRGLTINFVRGDMRELDYEAQFDGAYCLFSTFGYFDDETNKKTVSNIARALRPGGRLLIEILNRDYVIADLPTRVWWEGDGCVVLEEVDLNYFSSRIQVNRSVVFDDGRQVEQEISVRAYSLHEVGKLLHAAGFRVLEVSGAYHTRGRFFGNQSRHIIVLAERKDPSAG